MQNSSPPARVRQFTPDERQELIEIAAVGPVLTEMADSRVFRRLLCKRSLIWARWIGSTGAATLIIVRWGADFEDAFIRFIEGWHRVLQALGLA